MASLKSQVRVGKRDLQISNVDKVLWPRDGYTKGELIAYYRCISQWLLPHLHDRPLTLQRYPDGIDGGSFFEKEAPRGTPEWVQTVRVDSPGGRRSHISYIVCNDEATLTFVANLGSIVLHTWTSRVGSLDNPDFALFDLDPWEGCTLKTMATVALELRDILGSIGLKPVVKTSGSSGLHVVIPLQPDYDYEPVKIFAELVARRLAAALPDLTTLERMTAKRKGGTVYLDYVQVGHGKTLVPPFSVRARDGAPVSMPLDWSEVEALGRKRSGVPEDASAPWTIRTAPKRLAKIGDLWAGKNWKPARLEAALAKAQRSWRD
ncbi:MAG: non-homologous end-joining DNA ligase [Candidatus Eremiobacteraeota bacterium]|nr:non-homologous end-joining DNA ligase [Candidatus Eremiobacteraeota bacterium]